MGSLWQEAARRWAPEGPVVMQPDDACPAHDVAREIHRAHEDGFYQRLNRELRPVLLRWAAQGWDAADAAIRQRDARRGADVAAKQRDLYGL
jgi:hypothetical protein